MNKLLFLCFVLGVIGSSWAQITVTVEPHCFGRKGDVTARIDLLRYSQLNSDPDLYTGTSALHERFWGRELTFENGYAVARFEHDLTDSLFIQFYYTEECYESFDTLFNASFSLIEGGRIEYVLEENCELNIVGVSPFGLEADRHVIEYPSRSGDDFHGHRIRSLTNGVNGNRHKLYLDTLVDGSANLSFGYMSYRGCRRSYVERQVPCVVDGSIQRSRVTKATNCGAYDARLDLSLGGVCGVGQQGYYQLRNRMGEVQSYSSTVTWDIYDSLPGDVYSLFAMARQGGCEKEIQTFDLRSDDSAFDLYLESEASCTGADDGVITLDIFSPGAVPRGTINGEPLTFTPDVIPGEPTEAYLDTIRGLAPGTYTGEIVSDYCTKPFTITVADAGQSAPRLGVRLASRLYICEGSSSVTLAPVGTGGTGEYTYTWLDNGSTQRTRTISAAGRYTVAVTDKCGERREEEAVVVDLRGGTTVPFTFEYANADGTCSNFPFISVEESFADLLVIDRLEVAGRTVQPGERFSVSGQTAVVIHWIDGPCGPTSQTINGAELVPEVTVHDVCEGQSNGRVGFNLPAIGDGVPVITASNNHGNGQTPRSYDVPLSTSGGRHFGVLGGLDVGEVRYVITFPMGCTTSGYVAVRGDGTRHVNTAYDEDTNTCTYDVFCQDERIEGLTSTSDARLVPHYSGGSNPGRPCRSLVLCDGTEVGDVKAKKKTVQAWFYRAMLNQAMTAGVISSHYGRLLWQNVLHLSNCDRVTYCTSNMATTAHYMLHGQGSTPNRIGDPDCYSWRCQGFRKEYCDFGQYLPPGTIFNPNLHPNPTVPNCDYIEITLKQLVLWHAELVRTNSNYVLGAVDSQVTTLRDLAEETIRDRPGALDVSLLQEGSPNDPLYCAKVTFCIPSLRLVTWDRWQDVQCPYDVQVGQQRLERRDCGGSSGPLPLGPTCDGGWPRAVMTTCPVDWTDPYTFSERGTQSNIEYLCFPDDLFDEEVPLVGGGTNNGLVAIGAYIPGGADVDVDVTNIPPYFAGSDLDEFIPVIVDEDIFEADYFDALAPEEQTEALSHSPKFVNTFGSSYSYSEVLPGVHTVSQHLINPLPYAAEIVARDEATTLALIPPTEGLHVLAKDDGSRPIAFPEEVAIEAVATDREGTHLILSSDQAFEVTTGEGAVPVSPGRTRLAIDYGEDLSIESTESLGGVPLRLGGAAPVSPWSLIGSVNRTALLNYSPSSHTALVRPLSGAEASAPVPFTLPPTSDTILYSPFLPRALTAIDRTSEPGVTRVIPVGPTWTTSSDASFGIVPATPTSLLLREITTRSDTMTYIVHGASGLLRDGSREALAPGSMYLIRLAEDYRDVLLVEDLSEVRVADVFTNHGRDLHVAIGVPGDSNVELHRQRIVNNSRFQQSVRHRVELPVSPSPRIPEAASAPTEIRHELYPVPAADFLNIRPVGEAVTAADRTTDFEVFDVAGRRVTSGSMTFGARSAGVYTLSTATLPGGVYVLRLRGGGTAHAYSFVVTR